MHTLQLNYQFKTVINTLSNKCDPVCEKSTSGELSHFIVYYKTSKNHYSGENFFFCILLFPSKKAID